MSLRWALLEQQRWLDRGLARFRALIGGTSLAVALHDLRVGKALRRTKWPALHKLVLVPSEHPDLFWLGLRIGTDPPIPWWSAEDAAENDWIVEEEYSDEA